MASQKGKIIQGLSRRRIHLSLFENCMISNPRSHQAVGWHQIPLANDLHDDTESLQIQARGCMTDDVLGR